MKKILLIVLFIGLYLNINAQFKIVAYLPKYQNSYANHLNDFDFTKVTHINAAFFNPDANGNFHSSQGVGLDQIVTKAHQNNVKVLLSIGGGSLRPNYANLLINANRAAFVSKVVALVSLYNADGVDIDLEGENIDENYGAFITDLSAQLKPSGKLLTAAVAWWTRDRISDAALEAFDFINVMAYDKAGAEHSPYSYAKQHMGYWKGERGLPASKIIVGVPFYGWYTQDGALKEMNYKTLVDQYPGAENKDTITRTDGYVVNYNGIPTIKNKTAFSLGEGGGIMFWQVLQDDTGSLSLLKAIGDKINNLIGWKEPFITWKYNFNTGTGNAGVRYEASTTDKSSIATNGTNGFLPYPPYGSGRVSLPANSGGAFDLLPNLGSAGKLKITGASTGAPGKFSWFSIGEATSIASLSFNMELDAALTNGQIIIPIGYSTTTNSIFNNSSQLTTTSTAGVFGAIRLDFYGGTFATLSYRTAAPIGYAVINNNVIAKVGSYEVELYCNNNSDTRQYIKESVSYSLPPQTFNLWINGVLMKTAALLSNFPATGELAANSVINSFALNTSGNTGTPATTPPTLANSMKVTLENLSFDFAFKTVATTIPLKLLPVTLKSFNGKKQGQSVQLNWVTLSEANNRHFEIWRSSENTEFELLKIVEGRNTDQPESYFWTDFNPFQGTNYYSLKQVDSDGESESFTPISVLLSKKEQLLSAYIDSGNKLILMYNTKMGGMGKIILSDISGKNIYRKDAIFDAGFNKQIIDMSFAKAGVYLATIVDVFGNSTVKLIKQ